MSDTNSPKCNLRVAITHDDVVQFLYLVRSDMARIVRELEDIGRKLERMGARRNTRLAPLPKPTTRR
jgi:hypothetical protein